MVTDWGQPETNDEEPKRTNMVRMPKELTASNGAKKLLEGRFFVFVEVSNPNYDLTDNEPETYTMKVPIEWGVIKNIYNVAVKNLGKRSDK